MNCDVKNMGPQEILESRRGGWEEKKSSRSEGVQERIENNGLNMVKMHSIRHVMRPV